MAVVGCGVAPDAGTKGVVKFPEPSSRCPHPVSPLFAAREPGFEIGAIRELLAMSAQSGPYCRSNAPQRRLRVRALKRDGR
jgi:hypothetical protein